MSRILIVEDEKDVVTLIKFLLEKSGHQVTESYNGAEALEILGVAPPAERSADELPSLIIMDVMMPVMDGYTAVRRLQDNPKTQGIPVLILTAKGQVKDLFESAPNVAAYIEKPFDPKRLREMVDGILTPGAG